MTRSPDFPYCFAILRTDRVDGPCLQFLRAEIHHQYDGEASFTVQPVPWDHAMRHSSYQVMEPNEFDDGIYTFRYQTYSPTRRGVQDYKFWFLPFYYERNGLKMPVIDFQFKSWLPSLFTPIAIREDEQEFLRTYDTIHATRIRELFDGAQLQRWSPFEFQQQFDRFWTITQDPPLPRHRVRQQSARRGSEGLETPIRTPSPPRRTRRRETVFYEPTLGVLPSQDQSPTPWQIAAAGGGHPVLPAPAPVPAAAPAPAPPPTAIPKHIGAILLANARTGADSCPIAATLFAECGTLAVTSCFHIFDAGNLQRWQATTNTCPVCRTHIASVVIEEAAHVHV